MKKLVLFFALILFYFSIYYLSYNSNQNDFLSIAIPFTVAFIAYFVCYKFRNQIKFKNWLFLIILAQLIPLFATPTLSPDIYRFIWDGEIMLQGINPFSYAPKDLVLQDSFEWSSRLSNVYNNGITDLSKKYFSVYPTINQFYFLITAYLTESTFSFLVVLRVLILLTHFVGFLFLIKLLDYLSIPRIKSLLVVLNPLLIVELNTNFHFEGVMISFLLIALYFLFVKKNWLSSVFWAISINIKLSPLLILPFLFRFLGFKKSVLFYIKTLVFSGVILLLLVWPPLFANFLESVKLYYGNFEFNSSLFAWVIQLFGEKVDGSPIAFFGPIFSLISLTVLIVLALYKKPSNPKSLMNILLFAYVIYLFLSPTVHPWYLIIPLILSVFTNLYFVFLWSILIVFSYTLYDTAYSEYSRIVNTISYLIVAAYLIFEIYQQRRKTFC